jgi:hypothetical protein
MDAAQLKGESEKSRLVKRLAELLVEEQRAAGVFKEVPHYSVLEQAAHELGRQVSQDCQRRAAAEAAALSGATAACPGCGRRSPTVLTRRTVVSLDGPVKLVEPAAHCPACRRDFFPSA